MTQKPDWRTDGDRWPNREASRFVRAAGLRWKVQRLGGGPVALLLHGTGAATHSWAALAPLLAARFTVVAPDLPGHGFTDTPPAGRLSLPGMAGDLAELLRLLDLRPALVVGHSAGAAIGARMTLDGSIDPTALVGINPALLAFDSAVPDWLLPLFLRAARTDLAARLVAGLASRPGWLDSTLRASGSAVPAASREMYRRLATRPGHVRAVLTMLSNWDLEPLTAALPRLERPFVLLAGEADRWIPPADVERAAALLPRGTVVPLPGCGHLAHEERPRDVARIVLAVAREQGVVPA